ncbi:MAG TPA: alpha/beta hydrolase [Stenotrophomonas sp.]|jgi:pimeloyl-ACP methyl ester carboxylesterase
MTTLLTPSGVRLRLHSGNDDELNWLLLPGGPGIGSESLQELADCMEVPGSIWLVDLPGDADNPAPAGTEPFAAWPQVLIEAAQAMPNAVYAGHSTGGMYLLATPQVREHIVGLALLDTAPNCTWHAEYVAMTQADPLPAFEAAMAAYGADPSLANLTTLVVASAEWNFCAASLDTGRAMLSRMPYNLEAIEWSDRNFDHRYEAQWWPSDIPVLRLWGSQDRIVSQRGWRDPSYNTPNVMAHAVPDAGHFPWIENPDAVRDAFREFARQLQR